MLAESWAKKENNVMKKVKLSSITKVSSLTSDERVLSLSSDMKSLNAATKAAVGNNLSLGSTAGFTGDNAHELFERGVTIISIADGVANYGFPTTTGVLLNLQRHAKGVILNQYVFQLFFSPMNVYYRYGAGGSGTSMTYHTWKTFVFA